MKIGFAIFIIIILLGTTALFCLDYNKKVYEEVVAREMIDDFDNLLILIENKNYIEASYLAEAIDTQYWFLRNAYNTKFYDTLNDETNTMIWFFPSTLNDIEINCRINKSHWCETRIKVLIEDIKYYQKELCYKSDIYNGERIKKKYKKNPEILNYYLKKARC